MRRSLVVHMMAEHAGSIIGHYSHLVGVQHRFDSDFAEQQSRFTSMNDFGSYLIIDAVPID